MTNEKQEVSEDKPLPCPKIVRGQEQLTREQEAYARQFAQERITAMLSTKAVDEKLAVEYLRQAYQAVGLKAPRIQWFDSPLAFVTALSSQRNDQYLNVQSGNSLPSQVGAALWGNVQASIGEILYAETWERVGASILSHAEEGEEGSVLAIAAEVEEYLHPAQEEERVVSSSVRAYAEAYWLACDRFFHLLWEPSDILPLACMNEMVSGYQLGLKKARLVRKPVSLKLDEQGHLHSEDGMCLYYRDGWGFYAWHGVRVSEKVILYPEQITREDWLNEHDLEIRRVIQERLGNDRFVQLVGATSIDHGQRGILVKVDLGDDPEGVAHYVHVKDASTDRRYYLRVPPSITHADEAVAWTFGLDEGNYQPQQEA